MAKYDTKIRVSLASKVVPYEDFNGLISQKTVNGKKVISIAPPDPILEMKCTRQDTRCR